MSLSRFFLYNLNISDGSIIASHNSNTIGSLITTAGNIGIGTTSPQFNLDVSGNARISNNLIVPTGNISSRPVGQNGSIRYNSETQQFEGYGPGGAWGSLGGVIDISQTTKILASETPSTTDGNLYFITTGTERMRINSSGNIGIGTTVPSFLLDVAGTIRGNTIISTNITTTNLIATNFTASNFMANTVNYGVTSVFSGSFSASNNVAVPTNITDLTFSNLNTRSFQANVTISILRSSGGNLYQNYIFDGFQTDAGWFLYTSNIGDDTGMEFTITSQGQIQYTSTNITNFISNTIRYSVSQISNTGNYSFSGNLTQGTLLIDSIQIQNTRNSVIGTDPGSFQVLGGSTFQKGINILTTENAIGLASGGGLTVLGGGSISKDLFVGGTITTGNLEITGLTDSLNLTATNSSLTNIISTNITSSNIWGTTFSGSNLSLSGNLNVAGTLTVVNITSTNLIDTNLTTGIARITSNLIATGNSNTIGNIFTTSGNVGIGITNPNNLLHINSPNGTSIQSITGFSPNPNTTGSQINTSEIRLGPTGNQYYSTIRSGVPHNKFIDYNVLQFCTGQWANDNTQVVRLHINGFDGNIGIGTTSPNTAVTLDTAGIVRATQGYGTNAGTVTNLGTGGAVIHTFAPPNQAGHAILTASGTGNIWVFAFMFWIGNLNTPTIVIISSSGLTASINTSNLQISLATTSGTSTRICWNIMYLPTPNFLGNNSF